MFDSNDLQSTSKVSVFTGNDAPVKLQLEINDLHLSSTASVVMIHEAPVKLHVYEQ